MPWACAVPNCGTNKYGSKEKASMFKVPSDENLKRKWVASIPGINSLRSTQRVCENHFDKSEIIREYVQYDANGGIIAQVPFKRPRLQTLAVPKIFFTNLTAIGSEQNLENQCNVDRNLEPIHLSDIQNEVPDIDLKEESQIPCSETEEKSVKTYPQTQPDDASINPKILKETDLRCVVVCKDNNIEANTEKVPSSNFLSEYITVTFDSILFNFNTQPDDEVLDTNYSMQLPKPWNVCKSTKGTEEILLFTYAVYSNDNGGEKHVFEKTVVINANRKIQYEIYSTPVNLTGTKLPRYLMSIEILPEILKRFKDMRICKGIVSMDLEFLPVTLKNCIRSDWRHKECSLLSINNERCGVCRKLTKTLLQKLTRFKKLKQYHSLSSSSNPVEQMKLKMVQKKMKYQKRIALNLKRRLHLLTESIAEQQHQVASITEKGLQIKCASVEMPKNQIIVIKEIIDAAQKTDKRGRRYSDEFIMLCMLMNIRSQSYYEFLRKNDIIPLPCTKTIRDYLSLMGNQCGFDENFFKILKKSFNAKDMQKRHGVLVLDEINLRKSIAVSSKTLTYTGLTDYGKDGPQSTNIDDLATHGLVLMYQSLTEKYTQPIAVFASKNSVGGEDLAKIVLKGICLLENAGCFIHGVIGDGASTNRKMWKTLNIKSTITDFQNWFTHPLDNDRKVFMFSDTPHLIKCIRNRVYNNRQIRVNPKENYVKWEYFAHLFNIDSCQPGNARVCPKLSRRHIELDNTAKMRVRFATQIFSNSVAHGLRFYLSHKNEQFEGCEATIDFCLRINNIFDALNRKQSNEGLTPDSHDFKILHEALEWLNEWESNSINGSIKPNEFLTNETAQGLRMTITSTLQLCKYLIEKYNFKYLLTGKVNQDNLEKFFGTIRQAAGSNEHPTSPTFLHLYKLLSVYNVIKPPKHGNCTITEKHCPNVITILDLKEIYKKTDSTTATALQDLKKKLDSIITNDDWEADQVIEHDYSLSPVVDCIIYYVTGFFISISLT